MMRLNVIVVMCLAVLCSQSMAMAGPKKETKSQRINRLFLEGFKQSRDKNWKGCVLTFSKLSAEYPSASVFFNLARCYKEQGKYKAAKKYYKLALSASIKPFNPKTGKGEAAIEATQKAIKIVEQKMQQQERINTVISIANRARSKGDFNTAIKHYLEAYEIEQKGFYLLEAAYSAQKQGRFDYALSLAEQAIGESKAPLSDKNRKRALALKKELIVQIETRRKAKEDLEMRQAQRRYQFSWVGYTGLVIGSLGLAGLGYTAYEGQRLDSDIDALEQERDPKRYANAKTDILNRQSQAKTIIWVGSSLVAVGVGLFAWDFFTRGVEPWSVSVSPTTDGANVQMMWRF